MCQMLKTARSVNNYPFSVIIKYLYLTKQKTNIIMPVIAYNKKGQKQVFSDLAWKLLGKNKNGWVEKPTQTIENKLSVERPDMGPTPVKKNQVIENNVNPVKKEETDNGFTEEEKNEKESIKSEKNKAEFLEAVKGLSKTIIKDYFDSQNPPIKYKNKDSEEMLQKQFAEVMNYDIEKLQKAIG